jgi:hypothetical protein
VLRGVAFSPAVRGYPGGIADMAAEQGDLTDGDEPDGGTAWTAAPAAAAGGLGQLAVQPAAGTSVWQQSIAVWQEAGIDWLREARREPARKAAREPSPEDRDAAEADLQHTEPIPVVPAFDVPRQAGPAEKAGAAGRPADVAGEAAAATARAGAAEQAAARTGSAQPRATQPGAAQPGATQPGATQPGATKPGPAQTGAPVDEDLIVLDAGTPAAQAAPAAEPESVASAAPVDESGVDEDLIVLGAAAAAASVADGAAAKTDSVVPGAAAGAAPTAAGRAPAAAAEPGPGPGTGKRSRPSRRVEVVAAVTGVALVAGTIAGIAVARSGGPSRPTFGLAVPYPPATLADAGFPAGSAAPGPAPTLTAIAGAGKTIVAVGAQGSPSQPLPLILDSQDGGRTWARAAVGPSSAAPGPGATPVLAVRGPDNWLALGQQSAWTSANGRSWQAAPGLPMSAGDRVLGLARTQFGFIAVGENTPTQAGGGMTTARLWTSTNGRTWQRRHATTLQFDAGGGSVASLRWAAYRAGVIIVGGEISRPVVEHRGKRKIIASVESPGLWRSANGGVTWRPVKVPVNHGAAAGIAGLAASGPAFVIIRPGRTLVGRRDAVAFASANGSAWRYDGKLTGGRRAPLHVITVTASDQGFAVSGTTGPSRVAFVGAQGRGWHKTADQGRSASTIVTGVTVARGPVAVAAGFRHQPGSRAASPSPYLLLTGIGARAQRTQVGQPALAAAGAAADETVNSLAADATEQVAAGSAHGSPALWQAPANGRWAPSALSLPAAWHSGILTSVVHGDDGWLATGAAGPPAQPGSPAPATGAAMTSADGRTWHPAAGAAALSAPGAALSQAAAGTAGYVVVGSQPGPDGTPAAAAWYSAGLGTWARAVVAGSGQAGTAGQMLAVTADRPGFAAAGSVGSVPAVWTSRTGSAWQPTALPLPAGAASAVLTRIAALGGRLVAAGSYTTAGARQFPFAAVSTDGGRHWREAVLRAPGGSATITALAAAGGGYVVAGLSGPANNQAVAWWSADGLGWQGGRAVRGPVPGAMQLSTLSGGHGVLTGAGYAVTQSGEHPVLWHDSLR